jgi:hypothetical protein
MLDFAGRVHHSTNGNDIRTVRSSAIRLDTAWREHLSINDLRYFEARAGWLNRELGYE